MKPHRSFISLITFCSVGVLITALGLVVVFASGTATLAIARAWSSHNGDVGAAAQDQASIGDEETQAVDSQNAIIFEGVITDDHCGPRHDMGSAKSPAECARACVHGGGHYTIVSGDKMYSLAGRNDLGILAGERVTVTGVLSGNTIQVKSITRGE